MNDYNAAAAAAAAARRAAEARRRAEEAARRAAEAAAKKAAEAAKKAAAAAAAAAKAKAKVREQPSSRFEVQKKEAVRRERKSTRFEALKKPVRRESKSTRFEAISNRKHDQAREVSRAAREQYKQLNEETGTKKALEELGVQNAHDFQKLGHDYASQLNGRGEKLAVDKVQDKKALTRVLEATAATQHGEVAEKMKDPVVASLVANGTDPQDAAERAPAVEDAGLTPEKIAELATQVGPEKLQKTTGALKTLHDDDSEPEDKVAAALQLGGDIGEQLPDSVRERAIGRGLGHLPDAAQAIQSIDTLTSADASATDKAKAGINLGLQLKNFTDKPFPELGRKLSALDGPAKVVGSAMTLLDGDASLKDRALAGAQMAIALPELKGDLGKLGSIFKKAGIENTDEIVREGTALGKLGARGLDLDVVKNLPQAQLDKLTELGPRLDPKTLQNLGPTLKALDAKGTEAFMKVVGEMEPGTLNSVLASTDDAKRFTDTITRLDPKHLDDFAKAASEMDGGSLKLISKLGASAPASALNDFVPTLARFASNDLVGKALGGFGKLVDVMKLDLTGPVAAKALKGLGKLLPGISAAVSGVDAVKFGIDAAKLQGKQDDLAFLAHTGAKLNALDAALEFIPGVGTLAGVGTGVAALALDLGFSSEKAKFEKDPKGYEAPDWVKAANIGVAMIGPPPGAGIPELIATYGPKDAAELGLWAVGKGGKLATAAWDVIKKVGGPAAEIALEAVDKLKDLGAAGAEALEYIAKAPGELGSLVAEKAVEGLEDLGEAGVEALKSIASSGADVAKKAAEGLKNLADAGLDVAKDALGTLRDVPGAVGDFVSGLGDLLPDIDLPGPL